MGQSFGTNASYFDPADLATYIDARVMAEGLSDDGTPVTNPFVSAACGKMCLRASGAIESAATHRGKYTVDDLNNLTLASHELLVGIGAGLVCGYLRDRRAVISDDQLKMATEAEEYLDALRDGARIFTVQAIVDASNMSGRCESQTAKDDRGALTSLASRYFGRRGSL